MLIGRKKNYFIKLDKVDNEKKKVKEEKKIMKKIHFFVGRAILYGIMKREAK